MFNTTSSGCSVSPAALRLKAAEVAMKTKAVGLAEIEAAAIKLARRTAEVKVIEAAIRKCAAFPLAVGGFSALLLAVQGCSSFSFRVVRVTFLNKEWQRDDELRLRCWNA